LAAIVPNLSGAVGAIDLELRHADRTSSIPLDGLPIPPAIRGTDQTMAWLGGETLTSLSGGLKATTDGGRDSGRLARLLASIPRLDARYEFEKRGLTATFGAPPEGRLADDERYRTAVEPLGSLTPIGYLDMGRGRPMLGTLALILGTQAGLTAGYELPEWLGSIDRVAVGIDADAFPTRWRVVVSLEG
jgi:hypothetical protein